jgi:peptidoglycan/LPS O-acetylase OafA/YrhL
MPSRLPFIDALKALACQLIVLHHLAFTGRCLITPTCWPDLISWLSQDARIAVQVFLVIGGFLAAQSRPGWRLLSRSRCAALQKRYLKLVRPTSPPC